MNALLLQSLQTDLALIRGALVTHDQLSPDDPARAELTALIEETRGDLIQRWRAYAAVPPARSRLSLGTFKDVAINVMLTGLPRLSFGCLKDYAVFAIAAEANPRYMYELAEPIDVFGVQALPPDRAFALFLADVLSSAENSANYASKRLFDRNVLMKFVTLLFAMESAGCRFNDRDQDDDDANGSDSGDAPVPRRPIPPQLTGESAEILPERQNPEWIPGMVNFKDADNRPSLPPGIPISART